jgi:hypothetical protein
MHGLSSLLLFTYSASVEPGSEICDMMRERNSNEYFNVRTLVVCSTPIINLRLGNPVAENFLVPNRATKGLMR